MVLPPYKGAVFRGAFGNALKRLVCTSPRTDCRSCALRDRCLYIACFEPPPPPNHPEAGKFQQAPRPYVLNPPLTSRQVFHPGEALEFELVLIGPAVDALPYFIHVFEDMGRRGLGPERGKYTLLRVDHLRPGHVVPIFDGASRTFNPFTCEKGPTPHFQDKEVASVTLKFLTPLRLKEKGRLVTGLSCSLIITSLAQRLSLLTAFYGGNSRHARPISEVSTHQEPDWEDLLRKAEDIKVTYADLCWYDWKRWSRKQHNTMNLGGLKGSLGLVGDLTMLLPYLRLGAIVNVGQATTSGLGRYRIETF